MRDLASKGVSMIYISHRLDEIGIITDRVTVLRDGELVGTKDTDKLSKEEMISMMVGRVVYENRNSNPLFRKVRRSPWKSGTFMQVDSSRCKF